MRARRPSSKFKSAHTGQLDRQAVLDAIAQAGGQGGKRDIAKILGVKGDQRADLRRIIRELEDEGVLARAGRRAFASADVLPETCVIEIVDRDPDGDLLGRAKGRDGFFGPVVRLAPGEGDGRKGGPAIGVGDRALCRIDRSGEVPLARIMKRLGASAHRILGVFYLAKGGRGGRVEPADRKAKGDLMVFDEDRGGAEDGDLVVVEMVQGARPVGPRRARVTERFGRADDPRAASLIAMHAHGIIMAFTPEETAAALAEKPVTSLKGREDLRSTPLVTIDPEDARDHDDAVFAEADTDPANKGGWRVIVAIADVAHHVTPNSVLDRGAKKRGNSTYFPDRVAPMLPEELSADLCSLREGQDRPCLAVELRFDLNGVKRGHRFIRGLMRSAAKLSYGQAQAAIDGKPDDKTGPLLEPVLQPLWAAYAAVSKARDARSPLDLDSPELRIRFGSDGKIASIGRRDRFDAHRLIEEFMIQANVAAAETLEAKKTPLIYRIHDTPSREKIASLAEFLPTVGLKWSMGEVVTPRRFNHLLSLARGTEHAEVVNEVVLRSQAQAVYRPDNIGHFGLNLSKYAHFTSPIRRYADLVVHRALIRALSFGNDGLTDEEMMLLEQTAEAITEAERRSMAAERDATARYLAAFLADKEGATFEGRISGVTRFGAFVRLLESGADGLIPISRLGAERFYHDEATHALVGERSGRRYPLGMKVEVRLVEATPVSGGLVFDMMTEPLNATGALRSRPFTPKRQLPSRKPKLPKRKGKR
jgi:ribonuclease R